MVNNRDLRALYPKKPIFENPFKAETWSFPNLDMDNNSAKIKAKLLDIAFHKLIHDAQEEEIRECLNSWEVTPQTYRFVKELQLLYLKPDFYSEYQKYFEFNIDCDIRSMELLKSIECEDYSQAIERRGYDRLMSPYMEIEKAFDKLEELPQIVKVFRFFLREYDVNGCKKGLQDLIELDLDDKVNIEIIYQAILNSDHDFTNYSLEEKEKIKAVLNYKLDELLAWLEEMAPKTIEFKTKDEANDFKSKVIMVTEQISLIELCINFLGENNKILQKKTPSC